MKLFIAIISLLFGVIIGAAITAFLVIKKNPTVKNFLCSDTEINSTSANASCLPASILNNMDLKKFIPQETATSENHASETAAIISGPGGCKTEDDCLKYCSNLEHLQECIAFAKSHLNSNPQESAQNK
ncbi:MAG: hypothetical protein V1860_00215 [bacterium]